MPRSTSAGGKRWPNDVIAYIIRQDIGLRDLPEGDALPETGWVRIRGEEPYLDGPVTPRVAVLDLDVRTATLRPGARFVHGVKGRKDGWYEVPQAPKTADFAGPDPTSDAFLQVSVWGTVLDAIRWFEHPEVLGRQVRWAFGAPQLLVIPRAGEMANAFYHRETHSLQFYSFPAPTGSVIHTALSRDIVVHETAHAILDGVAPDLLGAITPQARALHEAVADLAAIFASLRDKTQIFDEVTFKGGDLQAPTAFSRLAEQLGTAVHRDIGADALRDANNDSTLDPTDRTTDRLGRLNHIADVTDVHGLSSVLTGAVFRLFLRLAQARRTRSPGPVTEVILTEDVDFDREERTVLVAAERIARMAFRALDYLPPGELSFADFARAVLAADQVVQPRGKQERSWLVEELVRRKVVDRPADLDVEMGVDAPELKGVDLHGLEEDAVMRSFVSANRRLFGLPPKGRFTVHPRLWLGRRSIGSKRKPAGGPADLVVKVSWPVVEDNDLGPRFPARRVFRIGTTLVLDAASRRIKARLQGEHGDPSEARDARQVFLSRLVEEGLLRPSDAAMGPDGVPLSTPMVARSVAGSMVAAGGARMLHWTRGPRCLT